MLQLQPSGHSSNYRESARIITEQKVLVAALDREIANKIQFQATEKLFSWTLFQLVNDFIREELKT